MISIWDRGSSVGVVTSVWTGRQRMRGCLQQEEECVILLIRSVPTQELTVFCSVDAEGEVDGEWGWKVCPSKGDSKNAWRYTSNPSLPPAPKCLVLVCRFFKQRDNFTFTILTCLRTLCTCQAMSCISQSDTSFTLTSVGTHPRRTAQYIFRQFRCKFADSEGRFFF